MVAVVALLLLLPTFSMAEEAATPASAQESGKPQAGDMDEVLKLRDPFKRPDIELSKGPPKTELEYYSLDVFKMVAVLTGPTRMRAILQAPDGRSFIVQTGQKIGRRNGVIQKIEDDVVRVRERIINVLGKEENVDSEIALQPDPRGRLVIRAAN
jgi:Tfp pilus assembly protein PilP